MTNFLGYLLTTIGGYDITVDKIILVIILFSLLSYISVLMKRIKHQDGLIENNKIEGSGRCALGALVYDTITSANNNTFLDNDISNFDAYDVDIILQGNNNTVIGDGGTVRGEGEENECVGEFEINK